jgi:hypothetical protein
MSCILLTRSCFFRFVSGNAFEHCPYFGSEFLACASELAQVTCITDNAVRSPTRYKVASHEMSIDYVHYFRKEIATWLTFSFTTKELIRIVIEFAV